ncbi:MAG: c-type cytochrome [Planctomycetes bacterium]|nr:c-type cytochrome [Planctomycetota bacterium]
MTAPKSIMLLFFLAALAGLSAQPPSKTGPDTEKRFPPLKVPPGFTAILFACDPLIEYPSVIALGPRQGTLFVAIDYMTGLGTEIVRRSEVRLIEDTNADGYADKATVVADGFNSIEGLAFDGRQLYVMHAPHLTAVPFADGKAGKRKHLVTGLGLPPEKNPVRLHCANGVVVGHDGWLYLALGDHGAVVQRPEGDSLTLVGGGILRCRRDGSDLHVFATGLRNTYDLALDADLNVLLRDNENDGGDYKVRICHSFFGADHGYPYLYYERPDEAVPPLADVGLGSSAGGACYLERQFPPEYRGDLFFCEWGRSVTRCRPKKQGSGFAPLQEFEFAAGAEKDPYGFRPTDIVVDHDGSLLVSDWADGQRPRRGRGRIYRIRHGKENKPAHAARNFTFTDSFTYLDSASHYERIAAQEYIQNQKKRGLDGLKSAMANGRLGNVGRLHAVWILAHLLDGKAAAEALFEIAGKDPNPRVQVQAVRALADLLDPALTKHRLDAEPGSPATAARLAALAKDRDATVVREVVVALGRMRWKDSADWLQTNVKKPDPFLAHGAMQTLRRSGNWPAVLQLLDLPSKEPMRAIALRAVADQAIPSIVDGLISRISSATDRARRKEYVDALTRIYQKPGPYKYWGYRPGPRPANSVAWERTAAIGKTLDTALADANLRPFLLARMKCEKITPGLATLEKLLADDKSPDIAAVLALLADHPPLAARPALQAVVGNRRFAAADRLSALRLLASGLDGAAEKCLLQLESKVEEGPVLVDVLRLLGRRPTLQPAGLLLKRLASADGAVRAAALDALVELNPGKDNRPANDTLQRLLQDKDAAVRRAAAGAAGAFDVRSTAEALAKLAEDSVPVIRSASLDALRRFKDGRALKSAVAALSHVDTHIAALRYLADLGDANQAKAAAEAARRNPANEVLALSFPLLDRWAKQAPAIERMLAELQGATGIIARWHVSPPMPPEQSSGAKPQAIPIMLGAGPEFHLQLPAAKTGEIRVLYGDVSLSAPPANVQFLAGSSQPFRVSINGRPVFNQRQQEPYQQDGERFDVGLKKGENRIVVELDGAGGDMKFHLRFRRKSSKAEHEKLIAAAMARPGNAERGRGVFLDVKKSQCLKCHRLGETGERIGPELTGVGQRFGRMHIVESILEPSRHIAPGFQTVLLTLSNGKVLTGIKLGEESGKVILADNKGDRHDVPRGSIDSEQPLPLSTMPDDLARPLSVDEFVDLIAFLVSQKR